MFTVLVAGYNVEEVQWGDECTYANDKSVVLDIGNVKLGNGTSVYKTITKIPAGKTNVMVNLLPFGKIGMDDEGGGSMIAGYALNLRVLVGNDIQLSNQVQGYTENGFPYTYNWPDSGSILSTTWSHLGMSFTACVDECAASFSYTTSDGSTRTFTGDYRKGEEWLYIDKTTAEVIVQVCKARQDNRG